MLAGAYVRHQFCIGAARDHYRSIRKELLPCCRSRRSFAPASQVLTYGIISAAVLRGIMIALGAELLENFKPVLLVFAAVLIYSSYKLLVSDEEEEDDENMSDNWIVQFCR